MRSTVLKASSVSGLLFFAVTLAVCGQPSGSGEDRILARLLTTKGPIVLELDYERAPLTTANFVGLAEGTIENGVVPLGRPFYDGTVFHRVVPDHVIQAGKPLGTTADGPDYTIPNEISADLRHDRPGILGMANSGPHTNGSQFYITLAERSYLDGDYTVFGRVVEGLDVVMSIAQGDVIRTVEIIRTGPKARAFPADTASFVDLLEKTRRSVLEAEQAKTKAEEALIATVRRPNGLRLQVLIPGDGNLPKKGDRMKVVYTGLTLSGKRFFSAPEDGRPSSSPPAQTFLHVLGKPAPTPALTSVLASMTKGEKRLVIAPPAMAYGSRGFYGRERPGEKRFVISPGTTLVYEVEVSDIAPPDFALHPVSFDRVTLTDRLWAKRLDTNRRVTIPYALRMCEETGRLENFRTAAKVYSGLPVERIFHSRYPFDDSDVYKIIEGASLSLKSHPDPELDRRLDEIISTIAAAQEADGYLYTARTIFPRNPYALWVDTPERWSNLRWGHELYNAGHLYEAAAAHFQATGKRTLLDVALKNADLVVSVFGPGKRRGLPGHEEIEIGLVKLFRLTGKKDYLDLARYFIEERGRTEGRESFGEYAQDHKPLLEQTEPVGHAVRAAYFFAGAADVTALDGDAPDFQSALETLWRNAVSKKMYLTGGIGAVGQIEGFGPDYHLPNATAYAETCASIAMALWSHRMFLLTGSSDYCDVLERLLYNGILSGIGLTGDRFFYANPLASFGQHERSSWFSCACCPSNLTRFLPSIPGFVYARRDSTIFVTLYADSRADIELENGETIEIVQRTDYPWGGTVRIFVEPRRAADFSVAVRIPGWARGRPIPGDLYTYTDGIRTETRLSVNGRPVPVSADQGWLTLRRTWVKGDLIEIEFPMPVRRVTAHEAVRENTGRVALERGPLVYCAEAADNSGRVSNLVLPADRPLGIEVREDLLGGVNVLKGEASAYRTSKDRRTISSASQPFLAVPYHVWAHRGRGEMAVWLAAVQASAVPLPARTLASSAVPTASAARPAGALNDLYEPKAPDDRTYPVLDWRPNKGTKEWVQYTFPAPVRISGVEVLWFDEGESGECRPPSSWRILYKDGTLWKTVTVEPGGKSESGAASSLSFVPVTTAELRLEFQCRKGSSAGIHEWRLR